MSKTVLVACKLPNGLILDGVKGENSVALNGTNTAFVPGAPGLTHIDADEWEYLKAVYAEHHAFKNNAIFATGSEKVADVLDLSDELKEEKTGFEGLDPNAPGRGLEPMDKKKLNEQLQVNQGAAPRKPAAGGKKNQMAAAEAAAVAGV